MSAGLPVFAVSDLIDANLSPVTMNLGSVSTVGHLTPYQLIDDYGLTYDLTHNTSDVYDLDITPANDYITVVFRGLVTTSFNWTGISSAQLQSPFFATSNISFRITVNNLNITSTIERCSVEDIQVGSNYEYHGAQQLYNVTSSAFTIYDTGTMYTEYVNGNPYIRYQYLVFASYRVPCQNTNFNTVMGNIMTQTVTVSQADQSSYNSILNGFIGDYNNLEMLNAIHTKLCDIYRYEQNTYGAVVDIVNRLIQTNSSLSVLGQVLDAINLNIDDFQAQVHTDNVNLYNLINNYINNPQASSAANEVQSQAANIESEQAEFDAKIESITPSYDSAYQELQSEDAFGNVIRNAGNAFSFWKTITEYILSSDNIGLAASALILASVVCFIVFMLRL